MGTEKTDQIQELVSVDDPTEIENHTFIRAHASHSQIERSIGR